MKSIFRNILVVLVLSAGTVYPVLAGPFEDAVSAYNRGDFPTAFQLFRQLSDQGHADAQYNIGVMYRKGLGVPRNDAEAAKWYRKAADQGDASAQYNIGVMYAKGLGVTRDDAEAAKWYRKAADQADASAQYNLGIMYANGLGVPQDDAEAHKWFNLSAAQGNETGRKYREIIAKKMTPAQIAEAQKLVREWKSK